MALAIKAAVDSGGASRLLVFDDESGRQIDLDLRGTKADVIDRLSRPPQSFVGRYAAPSPSVEPAKEDAAESRGPGRPRLGVVAREVTLLPRHWEWLGSQPGGVSAALRRLVEAARRTTGPQQQRRAAQEAAYHFMLAIAGDRPGYEEATRALFADDRPRLERCIARWPQDIRAHVVRLAFPAHAPEQ